MPTYSWIIILIAFSAAALVFYLIRRCLLGTSQSIWWIAVATAMLFIIPVIQLIDVIAFKIGVSYPPILMLYLTLIIILLKLLMMDIERTHQEILIRRQAQDIAILNAQLFEPKDDHDSVNK